VARAASAAELNLLRFKTRRICPRGVFPHSASGSQRWC